MRRMIAVKSRTWGKLLGKVGVVLATVAMIVWVMPQDKQNYFRVDQGKPWRYSDLTAPFDFPIYKSEQTVKRERDSLMKQYEPYYNYEAESETRQVRRFVSDFKGGIPGVPDDYISIIANRLRRIYLNGVMNTADYDKLHADTAQMVRIVNGKKAVSVQITKLYSEKAAYEQLFADELLDQYRQALQKCNLNDYITPNLTFDKERSDASLADLMNSIPLATGVAQKGQKIIGRGDIIDGEAYLILESLRIEIEKRSKNTTQIGMATLGETLYVTLFIGFFTIYLTLFRKDYFDKPRNLAMVYSLIIIFAVLTSLLVRHTMGHVFILPYAILPIISRVFMDSRTAFVAHCTMVLVCACMLQFPFDFIVVQIAAGMAAIYSLRELQYRSQLFKTAIIVTLVSMAMYTAYELMRVSTIADIDMSIYNYFIVNGMLLLFAYPMLYLMEKLFGFTSDITLIELSNTNQPLLRRLSEVAPGTFQHSIQVSNLASAIANKIGASSQLVRTGALYHDIGKMLNPIYFTENQSGANPHNSISDVDSAQMIISHVTEGLKLAEKSNLPTVIKDFISTHHGQGKTKYFYVKFKNEHPDEFTDDLLFTYPGPNPFTREQAILMMADTVEAASRSLTDFTETSIRDLVNRLVDEQLADGYFRECPITFRDIAYAKTVMIEKLKTMYHTRVRYPQPNK